MRIPKLAMPKGMLCDLEDLELTDDEPSRSALESRENYAKMALLLFHPFRDESILHHDENSRLWEKLVNAMNENIDSSKFWKNGARILQNMQDNLQCRKCKVPSDRIKATTLSSESDNMDGHAGRFRDCESDYSDYDDAVSVDSYNENEFEEDLCQDESCIERSLNDLKKGESLSNNKTINTRSLDASSIFLPGSDSSTSGNEASRSATSSSNAQTDNSVFGHGASKYKTLLAFISGATIRNNLQEDLEKSDSSEDCFVDNDLQEDCILEEREWAELGCSSNFNRFNSNNARSC